MTAAVCGELADQALFLPGLEQAPIQLGEAATRPERLLSFCLPRATSHQRTFLVTSRRRVVTERSTSRAKHHNCEHASTNDRASGTGNGPGDTDQGQANRRKSHTRTHFTDTDRDAASEAQTIGRDGKTVTE